MQGINMAEVEQYNKQLKAYKEKYANLKAELGFLQKEVLSACEELSADLGTNVTPDNIEQVYMSQMRKLETTLNSGNMILKRIMEEEQRVLNKGNENGGVAMGHTAMGQPAMGQPAMGQAAGHMTVQALGGGAGTGVSESHVPDGFMNEPVKQVTMPNKVSNSFFQQASMADFDAMSKPFNM